MSLLMDALKQQAGAQHDAPAASAVSAVSYAEVPAEPAARAMPRGLVFLLAGSAILGVGVSCGLVLHQLMQQPRIETPVVAPSSALPAASPGLILSDLLVKPTAEEQAALEQERAEQEQLVVSAEIPADTGQTFDEQVDTLVGEQQLAEEFPAGKVLGAARQMREADPSAVVGTYDGQTASRTKDYGSLPAGELSSDQVPQELKDKFQFAVDSVGNDPKPSKINEFAAPARDIASLEDVIQRQIPPIRFQAHVYATDPKQRWVKVNGKDLQEGQWITADIQLKEITPQYVLLQTGRQLFSMQALSEWSYRLKTKP